jgi:ABC-type spermidine/putrescine transport systems, ATPase components
MTPQLTVDIIKRLGQTTLEMRFTAEAEILVLFGPSGAGKTQTLQAIAGLSTPDSGQIRFDDAIFFQRMPGKPVVNLPARKRRIGYVFQQYALFPHMSALENVAFPLGRRRDARDRAMELLERMHLAHLAQRMPHELSGGQQQRIAIARALAAEPHILLLDESFSALDRPVRERLHEEIRMVQAERRLVVLYVTHNLDDAFAVGHRLAVVRNGRIEQIGRINDVFTRPANRHVLDILGIPKCDERASDRNRDHQDRCSIGMGSSWKRRRSIRLQAPRSLRIFARKIFASSILIVRSAAWSCTIIWKASWSSDGWNAICTDCESRCPMVARLKSYTRRRCMQQ